MIAFWSQQASNFCPQSAPKVRSANLLCLTGKTKLQLPTKSARSSILTDANNFTDSWREGGGTGHGQKVNDFCRTLTVSFASNHFVTFHLALTHDGLKKVKVP